jgi:hypothetical protein
MRKPYTMTKAREKWTPEEHARFVHAIKLYGRSWKRIEGAFFGAGRFLCRAPLHTTPSQAPPHPTPPTNHPNPEHVGTKTAVQVRSHAQKFFNKLEKKKEAGEQIAQGETGGNY